MKEQLEESNFVSAVPTLFLQNVKLIRALGFSEKARESKFQF